MSNTTLILLICGLYLLATLVTGLLSGRSVSRSVTGYVAGDRTMNVLVLYFVIGASIFSAFAFLGGPGWAYARGAAAFYIIAYGIIGMLPMYFMGPRTQRIGTRLGFVTQAELLAHRFNSKAISVLLAALTVVVLIPYLTLQMKGVGYILTTISGGQIPEWLGALLPYLIVVTYVLTSGVMGVGWTNTFQGVFMMVVAWFLGLYLPYTLYGGIGPMFEQIAASDFSALLEAPGLTASGEPWSWWGYSSAVIVSAVGFTMWPHLFMKSYAAKSAKALRLTVVLYPTFQLFLVPILLIGFAGVLAYPNISPADTIVPHILLNINLSPVLVGLVCAGVLAASMSSGDSILHAAASIGVRDGFAKLQALTDQQEQFWIRVGVVLISAVAYYFAVVSELSIVALLLGAYGGVAQIFPLVFAAFYWPRATGRGALAALVVGIGVNTLFLVAPDLKPFPMHEGVYGLIANVLILVIVSLRTAPEPSDTLAPYLALNEPD